MDPRELIRLAQADELAGDLPSAAEKLRKAAAAYRAQGKDARAEQLERHADRLSPGANPVHPERSAAESKDQNAPNLSLGAEDPFANRGPSLADPSLDGWCSFCCRPSREVGELVASPSSTSAFICKSCVAKSASLLGGEVPVVPTRAAHTPAEPLELLDGQSRALTELERALVQGARCVLLLGLEGSGASTLLTSLSERGAGERVRAREVLEGAIGTKRLLIDDIELLTNEEREQLALSLRDRDFILAMHGELPAAAIELKQGPQRFSLFTSAELRLATANRLPLSLREAIDSVVGVPRLTESELRVIARRFASRLGRTILPEVLDRVVEEALRSGRGAHEVLALLRRVPAGAWSLASGEEEPSSQ